MRIVSLEVAEEGHQSEKWRSNQNHAEMQQHLGKNILTLWSATNEGENQIPILTVLRQLKLPPCSTLILTIPETLTVKQVLGNKLEAARTRHIEQDLYTKITC